MPTVFKTEVSKYRLIPFRGQPIEKLDADKTTGVSVWIKGQRQARHTHYTQFFDTYAEALDYLHRQADARVENITNSLEAAKAEQFNIRQLPAA